MTAASSHSALWAGTISEGGRGPGGVGRLATCRLDHHATADHHTLGRDFEFSRVGRHSAPNRPTLRRRLLLDAGASHSHRARPPNGSTQQSVPQRVTAGSVSGGGGRGSLSTPRGDRVDLQPRCLSLVVTSLHRVGLPAGGAGTATGPANLALMLRRQPPSDAPHEGSKRHPCDGRLHAQQHEDVAWKSTGRVQRENFGRVS